MTTKRVPLPRSRHARITPEVLDLWKRLRVMTPRERNHSRDREYLDGMKELCNRLGLWWGDAPDYMQRNPYQAGRWRVAWRWRCALIEAEKL
jgi:hypothetical protein